MRLTVYCGANAGNNPAFREAAASLGAWMARRGIGLVYGGGKVGLMGVVADAVLTGGGTVTGVIPRFLKTEEQAHTGLTEMLTVETMAERKAAMLERGDAFLALPGGPGTLEEISEAYSLYRLGRHEKPCLIYNAAGCYDALEQYFETMRHNGFLSAKDRAGLHFVKSIEEIEALLRLTE